MIYTNVAVLLTSLVLGAEAKAGVQKMVKPTEVRAIVADGKHNAFTAMVRWRDAFWLAFRKAASHGFGDGDVIVPRSIETLRKGAKCRFWGSVPHSNFSSVRSERIV